MDQRSPPDRLLKAPSLSRSATADTPGSSADRTVRIAKLERTLEANRALIRDLARKCEADATHIRALRNEMDALRRANAALQRENAHLREVEEELAVANEELRISNENLENTTEELLESRTALRGSNEQFARRMEERTAALRREIAERKRSEQALIRRAEHFRRIVEQIPVMVYALDDQGRFIAWNHECERVTGYEASDIIGEPDPWTLLCPDEASRKILVDHLHGENAAVVFDWEAEIMASDGQPRVIAWSHLSSTFPIPDWPSWGVGRDVTARHVAETALAESRRTLQTLIDATDDGMVLVDRDHRIVRANAAVAKRHGTNSGTLKGKAFHELVPPDSADRCRKLLQSVFDTALPAHTEVEWSGRHYAVSFNPVAPTGSRTTHVAVSSHDMTEHWALEQSLRAAGDEAEDANTAKSRFLAYASHDVRQPLQAMGLFLRSLEARLTRLLQASDHPSAADVEEVLDRLGNTYETLQHLIDELLDLSKLEAGVAEIEIDALQLDTLTRRLEAEFRATAEDKGLDLRFVHSTATVQTDALLIERAFRNLIGNALRYTDQGRVLVGARRRGNEVVVQVSDTGPGIAEESRDRIFEEFYTADPRPGGEDTAGGRNGDAMGAGLGLSIVRRTCDLLGCGLTLHSERGKGATFGISLRRCASTDRRETTIGPLAGLGELAKSGELLHARITARPVGPVLIIENNKDIREALEQVLTDHGFGITAVDSPAEARRSLTTADTPPACIVADYDLGDGETGLATIRNLRKAFGCRIPSIILTAADGQIEENRAALKRESIAWLIKPVRASELSASIIDAVTLTESATPAEPD